MGNNDCSLIVFVKNKQIGKVKTRIGNVLGHEVALNIYSKLCDKVNEVCSYIDFIKWVYYSDYIEYDDIWNSDFNKKIQTGIDLGERMAIAFQEQCIHGNASIIIGTDCPYITEDILSDAKKSLENHDIVIGPAYDGGYYLLGMRDYHPFLFKDILWSTDQVLNQTIDLIIRHNLTFHVLETLHDIDEVKDWEEYMTKI